LIGLTVIANKLPFESEYHGSIEETKMIVEEYKGNLLSVVFRDNDLDYLVPFPVSVVAINNIGEITKQYLVSMEYALDERDPVRRKEGIQTLLKHCSIVEPDAEFQRKAS
jgi:hypothetical protein